MKNNNYKINTSKYGTHMIASDLLTGCIKVLDVGCNEGFLAQLNPDVEINGIDNNEKALSIAKKYCKKVWCLDLNKNFTNKLGKYDVIILSDILEHLINPNEVLNKMTHFLKQDGEMIISLPNVANFRIRLKLLYGSFDYTEAGILDKTHFHLYTLKTARELVSQSNLYISKIKYSSNYFGKLIEFFPYLGELLGYNIILQCKKNTN